MTIVVGLVGRIASGKGEIARYLAEKHGARVVRFSDLLRDVLATLDIPDTRENLQAFGLGLRSLFGDNVLVKAMKKRIMEDVPPIVVVDGVRYPEEAKMIRSLKKNLLLYVDAPFELRYKRAVRRGTRGESGLTLEEFKKSDEKETEKKLGEIKNMADKVIENTGSLKELRDKVDVILSGLK